MRTSDRSLKILLVEDEDIARTVLFALLKKQYPNVITAVNGEEGFFRFNEESPDIIITDLEMPLMSGEEMIHRIRKTNDAIPIIVTTAYSDKEEVVDNVQGYLIKPISKDILFSKIESFF